MFSFFNIDRIFDFLLSIGMRPLVELSFMPSLLASGNATWSHYRAGVTPPADYNQWANLIAAFMKHLIQRYSLAEILTWSFEVWNEPNCCPHTFWTGGEAEYFKLFEYTYRAAKSVHPQIRVGGPATGNSLLSSPIFPFSLSPLSSPLSPSSLLSPSPSLSSLLSLLHSLSVTYPFFHISIL